MNRAHLADFSRWADIFAAKSRRGELLPWTDAYQLTPREKALITRSVQQFELGENAQGRSLRAAAVRYAEQSGDWDYLRALDLFIREEQRHSSYLRQFMLAQQLPLAPSHWLDESFRWLRKRAGLEIFIVVLVSAEIVAIPYYRALRQATRSPLLKAICTEILCDEADHLCFQGNALRKLRGPKTSFLERIFMVVTCAVVWHSHRQILRCGGYNWASFTRHCLRILSRFPGSRAQPPLSK